MNIWFLNIKQEIQSNPLVYTCLVLILAGALWLRVYRIDQLLGFYFDQGRDAGIIWDFWHNHRVFLIGPTTGIEGIFRGPWYYWLIAPWYAIGKGNPLWPSIFLSLTTVVASAMAFVLGKEIVDRRAGMLAAFITAFSYHIVYASRWLSNPTPMLLISMLLVWSLFRAIGGKQWAWVLIGFLLGQAMQFGSAAEVFYFVAVIIISFWLASLSRSGSRKNFPTKITLFLSILAMGIVFFPQIWFNFRHDGVLRHAITNFLFGQGSFNLSFWQVLQIRLPFYFEVFSTKLFLANITYKVFFAISFLILLIIHAKQWIYNKKFVTVLILLIAPIIGMLFFQGNYGNVYDYYFTGYYLIFILTVSSLLAMGWQEVFGRLVLSAFLLVFVGVNAQVLVSYLSAGVNGPESITFDGQKKALEWVYQDADNRPFNVDTYVPPVIPYAYDYLFTWWGTNKYNLIPVADRQENLLYTVFEQDSPHPERLDAWLARQKGIAIVEKEARFGGITVQRRTRISKQ